MQPDSQPAPEPAQPLPDHFYSVADGDEYGYEQGLSENDQKAGTMSKPLLMMRFLGSADNKLQIEAVENAYVVDVMDCTLPCKVMRARTFANGQIAKKEFMPIADGSIIQAVMMDAARGKLKQYRTKSGKTIFYNDANQRISGNAPTSAPDAPTDPEAQ